MQFVEEFSLFIKTEEHLLASNGNKSYWFQLELMRYTYEIRVSNIE
jgi:hypothetical protein